LLHGRDDVLRRLAAAVPRLDRRLAQRAGPRAPCARRPVLVRAEGVPPAVLLHLAARNVPALSLRPADEPGVEVADPPGDRQRGHHRGGGDAADGAGRMSGGMMWRVRQLLLIDPIKGLWLTLRIYFEPHVTVESPRETVVFSPRFRGVPRLRRDPETAQELCI